MTNEEKLRQKSIEDSLKAQKESSDRNFKQDCRRTALQMAERSTKDPAGEKGNTIQILQNADLFYQWLTKEI